MSVEHYVFERIHEFSITCEHTIDQNWKDYQIQYGLE